MDQIRRACLCAHETAGVFTRAITVMSEFRQYRLASQLFDRYSCLRDPKTSASHLFSHELKMAAGSNADERAMELAQSSANPVEFLGQARYLKETFPTQFAKLVMFLEAYNTRKVHAAHSVTSTRYSAKSTPIKLEAIVRPDLKPRETEDRRYDELDDIAKKLERVSHKLGRPASNSIPVPLESDEQETDFLTIQFVKNDPIDSLRRMPQAVQELCVIEDVLFLVMNLDGKYFSYKQGHSNSKHAIFVDESVDPSILTRLRPVLKAAYCASRLREFVLEGTRMNNGQVMQALAHALDVVLKEFFHVIMALDRKFKARELGLHQFCFHLAPFTRSLQSLLHLTFEIESKGIRGGALIRLLEDKMASVSGDRQLRGIYAALLEGCAKPFLETLSRWIAVGAFSDPHQEFMIADAKRSSGDGAFREDFLDTRYAIAGKNVPRLLEDLQAKILLIGLYRNIEGFLNKSTQPATQRPLQWDRRALGDAVAQAHTEVNGALMASLFQSGKLLDTMCAAKRFFFIEKNDFVENFLSSAHLDLIKPSKDVTQYHLQSSFELALKNSSLGADPHCDLFSCELASSGLYDTLVKIIQNSGVTESSSQTKAPKAVELLTLNMKIDFPESLVMNSKAMAKYQLVFRHILQCLELVRGLSTPLGKFAIKSTQQRQFETMKQSMLQFVRTVHYYICYNVLEPHWERFSRALKERKFTSVEEITDTHMDFLDTCLRESMLTNSKLVQLIGMIWSTCSKFLALIQELNSRIQAKTLTESTFQDVLGKFVALHQHFLKYVRVLIEALQYYAARDCDHYIANFLSSLDCQFYVAL